MQDQTTRPLPVTPPPAPPVKGEAKNDMLAWAAFLWGWFWPLGLILGHSSNRAAKRDNRRRSVLAILGLVWAYIALGITGIVILTSVAGSSTTTPAIAAPAPPASSAPAAPAAPADTAPAAEAPAAPASSAPAPAAPAEPVVTASQQQALDSASSYLDMGNGFSRGSLIDQLKFEKFSEADATYAADHSGADWNAQAVMSAKGYMDMKTGFSRGSLIDQLTFEKFTLSQATYAANHVGL